MKLLFAGAMACFVAVTMPNDTQAAVFAAHLEMVNNGNGTYNLNYRLNEDANQGVTINIKGPAPANTIVRTLTFPSQVKGQQMVVWDGKNNSNVQVPDGTYTWEVVASTNNTGGGTYLKTVDGTQREHTFYAPYGLDVNNNPASPHFGEVYVANSITAPGNTVAINGRPVTDGIYILSNDLQDITSQGDTAYGGGVEWAGTSSPWRVFVAPDDDVFITDWSDTHSGVWIMDPDDPSAPFAEIFDNTTRDADGLTVNHGSISSVYVEGTGAERVMYVLDEDYTTGTATQLGSVWAHAIGETESGYVTPPVVEYDDEANGGPIINFSGKAMKDPHPSRDGWFISQYRFTEAENNPNLLHFNGETIDWKSSTDYSPELDALANSGAFDISADGTLLAAAGFSYVKIIDINDLNNESLVYIDGGVGTSHRDIAFDPAGNFVVSSSNTEQILYYSKQGTNSFSTPNPVGSELVVGASNVSGWELY